MSDYLPFSDLRTTGVLWAVNRTLFHPRGYALSLHYDGDQPKGQPSGWNILGDGSECWSFTQQMDDRGFDNLNKFLRENSQ